MTVQVIDVKVVGKNKAFALKKENWNNRFYRVANLFFREILCYSLALYE